MRHSVWDPHVCVVFWGPINVFVSARECQVHSVELPEGVLPTTTPALGATLVHARGTPKFRVLDVEFSCFQVQFL